MKRLLTAATLITAIATAALFLSTNPATLPVGFLMLPIVLTFLLGFFLALLLLKSFHLLGKQPRKQRTVALIFGSMCGLFLVFQSTGGVVKGDLILVMLIFVVSYLYISKY